MNFWKEHVKLRVTLMLLFSVVGITLTIYGWTLTKQMTGLIIMIAGVALLLAALWIYNRPFITKNNMKQGKGKK